MEKYCKILTESVFDLLVAVGRNPAMKTDKEIIKTVRKVNKMRIAFNKKINETLLKEAKQSKAFKDNLSDTSTIVKNGLSHLNVS